jgi:glycosyltransferase involved in cell wall biosynthesis
MNMTCSVIIACNNAETVIVECLSRLMQQGEQSNLEIIVADGSNDTTAQLVEAQFPTVKLLRFKHPSTLPVLRGSAIALATGQIIALLDPYTMVSPDWLKQVIREHTEHTHAAIGGAVNLYHADDQGIFAWAQYFNEYGMFMSPVEEDVIEILPGCNISYKRELLFDGDKPRFEEFWKTFVHAGLEESGGVLWQTPRIHVELWKPIGFVSFLMTRFSHGRCYAAMRCADSTPAARFLRFLTTPLVPFVLQYRWTRRIWPKHRYRARYILSLPIQFILFTFWSVGEFAGYLTGAGNSCRKLYY